jgi:TfoX/Sxy family transcriptional regulator of competence genes
MATDLNYIQYIHEQAGLGNQLSHRKMFGEYALYLRGKVLGFVCDNQLFLKPTEPGKQLLGKVKEGAPYPGAKAYWIIDEALDDTELLQRLLIATADALPLPAAKAPRKSSTKKKQKTKTSTQRPKTR